MTIAECLKPALTWCHSLTRGPLDLIPEMIFGFLTRSVVPWPSLPCSPSPQLEKKIILHYAPETPEM